MRRLFLLASCLIAVAIPAGAQEGGWHVLPVPGGRATLRALGVDDTRERSAVMIELIRRLHFTTASSASLEASIRALPTPHSPLATSSDRVTLPLPMAPAAWERVVGRSIPADTMLRAILSDAPARLLFHGLAGLDGDTRAWFESEPALLRTIYRDVDAVKAFAMFAPAIRVAQGRIVVPGGALAEARWSKVTGAATSEPRRFVSRLFAERAGRAAGLYFLSAYVDTPRRQFVLHVNDANGDERFARLVSTFAGCFPKDSNDYPFVLRPNDPALLLLGVNLSADGRLLGPRSESFWDSVFASNDLSLPMIPPGGREVDAASLVERLCGASTRERASVFETMLAGQRVFANVAPPEAVGAVVALRVRRLFPAVFIAMERAGVRSAETFAAVGRHAAHLDRLNDGETTAVTLQQFQGALALTLRSAESGTISPSQLSRLLASLSDVRVAEGRYSGRLAAWFEKEFLAAIAFPQGGVVEYTVARALAGPAASPAVRVTWEDLDYVVDYPGSTLARLMAVRQRQGGDTLDRALELSRRARTADDVTAADAAFGHVLASWAYAPHVGAADSGALVGGDGSRRHDIGIREVNRTRFDQRWALAVTPGDRGVIAGSYLGLEAGLATWSLRRLTADVIPPPPTLGDNDRMSLFAMVSLGEPSRVDGADPRRITVAIEEGRKQLVAANGDGSRIEELAAAAVMSPWRRNAIRWMAAHEPDRIGEQFSLTGLARIGGLHPSQIPAWGTSAVPMGCLCVAPPLEGPPELIAGRPVDGIVGTHSADLPLRVAQLLTELKTPAQLMPAVLAYAMRDYIDRLRPAHPADADAFARTAPLLTRTMVEDYLGAIAAVGPLRPVQ